MCIRMRKLHEEHQVPAVAHDWYQTVISFNKSKVRFEIFNDKTIIAIFFWWSVRTLAQ